MRLTVLPVVCKSGFQMLTSQQLRSDLNGISRLANLFFSSSKNRFISNSTEQLRVFSTNHYKPENKITDYNNELSELYCGGAFDQIGNLKNIRIVEKRVTADDEAHSIDCIRYICDEMGLSMRGEFSFTRWEIDGYVEIDHPKDNDIICYHQELSGSFGNHIGIVISSKDGIVQSKFGYGHVYQHPFKLVPRDYGPYYTYYTKVETDCKLEIATIENMEEWIKNYKSISTIQISFPPDFSETVKSNVHKALKEHPNFISTTFGGRYHSPGKWSAYIEFKVTNNYLSDIKNRQKLKELYAGNRKNL